MVQANETIQKRLEITLANILRSISKTTSCANPKVIQFPALFRAFYKDVVPSGTVHPNPINSLVITPIRGASIAFVPSTGEPSFDNVIKTRLSEVGVQIEFVSSQSLHETGGDFHCASNQIQVCHP